MDAMRNRDHFKQCCIWAMAFLLYAAPGLFSCSERACHAQSQPSVVLVDYRADWCAPCLRMDPIIEHLRSEGIEVQTVNIANMEEIKARGLEGIPCFVVMVNGQDHGRAVGLTSEANLVNMLRNAQPVATQQQPTLAPATTVPEPATWRIKIGQ